MDVYEDVEAKREVNEHLIPIDNETVILGQCNITHLAIRELCILLHVRLRDIDSRTSPEIEINVSAPKSNKYHSKKSITSKTKSMR